MSDENNNDSAKDAPRGKFQRVSVARHWRQRFAGSDADYIYRKPLNIRGSDGKMRRVSPGEPVDVEGDGLVARRLKALWYAEAIELADPTQQYLRRKVVVRNNLAIRQEAEAAAAKEKADEVNYRRAREKQRLRERQEAEVRADAERAVQAAEEREERELAALELEERNAERAKAVSEELAENREREIAEAAEAASRQVTEAAERAQLEAEKAELDAVRSAEQASVRAEHAVAKAKRIAERDVEIARNRRSEEEREALAAKSGAKPSNPNNKSVSAKEARKAFGKRPGDKE